MRSATLTFLIAVLALAGASPAVAKKPKRSPCPGGRFLVEGAALVAGDSAAPHEPVVLANAAVSIGDVCPSVTGKLMASKRGTTVKATWRGCVGLAGRVHLKATLDATCSVLTGTLVARRGTPKLASATKTNVPMDRFLMCRLLGGGCLRLHERIAMAVPVGLISARIDSGLNPAERRASWRPPPATLGSPRTREHAASIYGRGYSP